MKFKFIQIHTLIWLKKGKVWSPDPLLVTITFIQMIYLFALVFKNTTVESCVHKTLDNGGLLLKTHFTRLILNFHTSKNIKPTVKYSFLLFAISFQNSLTVSSSFKVDRESCYWAFLLRIKFIQIVLLLLLVYSPAFSFMS